MRSWDARENVDSVRQVRRAVAVLLTAAVDPRSADLCELAEVSARAFGLLEVLENNLGAEADRDEQRDVATQ